MDYGTLLRDHTTLTCKSIDRIFLQAYVPDLQTGGGAAGFLLRQRGFPHPSSAAFGKLGEELIREIDHWAASGGVMVHHFEKGENKEGLARPLIDAAKAADPDHGRVVLLGKAQERATVWRSWRTEKVLYGGRPHMSWGRQAAFINHFYFYLYDEDWGPAFWKTNAYSPYPIWIYLNGHEWAKRQLEKAGIGYQALDNGFRSCEDPDELQRICSRLGPGAVRSFFWRWFHRLPTVFTSADLRAGYVYELATRQFEVSDTRVFERPQSGRAFFEGLIRDHLDIGRPEQVVLVFDRRLMPKTPGRFSTKVLTKGVDPQVSCKYKSSRIKQYFKEGRALRTETVICDTRDFGIGRRVNSENWRALRAVGDNANQRLCDAQAQDAAPAPDVVTLQRVTRPTQEDGQHAPALCFGDPRVMAMLAAIVTFTHVLTGFRNGDFSDLVGSLLGVSYTRRQATYDLRRLRRKGLIARVPNSQRYLPTPFGRAVAVLFLKAQGRMLGPAFALCDAALPAEIGDRSPLARAWRHLDRALDDFMDRQQIAA
jgi:hypothetical protein